MPSRGLMKCTQKNLAGNRPIDVQLSASILTTSITQVNQRQLFSRRETWQTFTNEVFEHFSFGRLYRHQFWQLLSRTNGHNRTTKQREIDWKAIFEAAIQFAGLQLRLPMKFWNPSKWVSCITGAKGLLKPWPSPELAANGVGWLSPS